MTDHYFAREAVAGSPEKWGVFFRSDVDQAPTFICSHASEEDATHIADLLNDENRKLRHYIDETQKFRDYLDNVRTGKGHPVTPGIERTLLIALLQRARRHLPGIPGDPATITDEMLDPEESGTIDASRAQLALDIDHAYELLEIDS